MPLYILFLFYHIHRRNAIPAENIYARPARLLCEGAHKPCGSCKPCHNVEHRQHPDVQEVPHSGKTGGFSVESIRRITAQTLYDCHKAFYTPANMCLVVVGDVDPEEVLRAAREVLPKESGPG